MMAALYVAKHGIYTGVEGIDAWTKERDARKYRGPHPVVCHPPCERWGSYWYGSPSGQVRYKLGEDGGCFPSALGAVRVWGGVLEHPAFTRAFPAFGLEQPNTWGGWKEAGDGIGYVCHVEQGHYGHAARKATWLYARSRFLPDLTWGESLGKRMTENLSKKQRAATPLSFMKILWGIAHESRT